MRQLIKDACAVGNNLVRSLSLPVQQGLRQGDRSGNGQNGNQVIILETYMHNELPPFDISSGCNDRWTSAAAYVPDARAGLTSSSRLQKRNGRRLAVAH
jgi:hypothetical protein